MCVHCAWVDRRGTRTPTSTEVSFRSARIKGTAPDMSARSYPTRKPPKLESTAMDT